MIRRSVLALITALPLLAGDAMKPNDPAAREALQATRNSMGWDQRFPGFEASIDVLHGGRHHAGTVVVTRQAKVTVGGIEGEAANYARQALASIVVHSLQRDFDKGDGKYGITFGEDDQSPLGKKIVIHGDAYKSFYRVRDGQLTQVNRTMGKEHFTIDMLSVERDAEGRKLRQSFVMNTWMNANQEWVKNEAFRDENVIVDKYALPRQRYVIITEPGKASHVQAITLSAHQLLKTGTAE